MFSLSSVVSCSLGSTLVLFLFTLFPFLGWDVFACISLDVWKCYKNLTDGFGGPNNYPANPSLNWALFCDNFSTDVFILSHFNFSI